MNPQDKTAHRQSVTAGQGCPRPGDGFAHPLRAPDFTTLTKRGIFIERSGGNMATMGQ